MANNASRNSANEFYFQWHFLNSCNLRCTHCYQENYVPVELPIEQLLTIANRIIDALDKWGMYGRISLTGGEPFVSHSLYSLLDYLDSQERICSIHILTNGTLITDSVCEKLKKYKKLDEIQVSLDGGTAAVHDVTRGTGNFAKAINGIRLLKKYNFKVSSMFTITNKNKSDIINFIDLAVKEHIDYISLERVTPCGHSDTKDILSKEELHSVFELINKKAEEFSGRLVVRRTRPLWTNLADESKENKKVGGFCPVGFTCLAILCDGTLLPCRRLEIPIGNVLTDGIFKPWYSSKVLWDIRDKNNLKGKCHGCKKLSNCGGCRAVSYALTGDYLEEDPQCWMENQD